MCGVWFMVERRVVHRLEGGERCGVGWRRGEERGGSWALELNVFTNIMNVNGGEMRITDKHNSKNLFLPYHTYPAHYTL